MNIKDKLIVMVLFIMSFASFSQAHMQATETSSGELIAGETKSTFLCFASSSIEVPQDGNTRMAKRGDIASGLIIKLSDREISLDINPCEEASTIVIFREPFRKLEVGKSYCKGKEISIAQIQQY